MIAEENRMARENNSGILVSVKINFFAILFLVLACASFFSGYVWHPMRVQQTAVRFEVTQGEGVMDVMSRLYAQKLIPSRVSFLTYTALSGALSNLKPGLYALKAGNIPEIVEALAKGPGDLSVTLAPGITAREADEVLAREGIIQKGELAKLQPKDIDQKIYPFLKNAVSLEGFLMPDTYRFKPNTPAKTVAERLLDNFKEKTESLWKDGADSAYIQRTITIASMIEKEVSLSTDRKKVSGIIYNRLADAYPLQIDATVAYGACDGMYASCDAFTAESFKKDTPFNTYIHAGLPPHAIASPSVDAIDAALHPQQNDYYFYLTNRKTGETLFSKTFEEHTQKRNMYLKN